MTTVLDPWNPVRIDPVPNAFRCVHCGVMDGTDVTLTVRGFMRKLRAFEREHNKCAPDARRDSIVRVADAAITKAKDAR